ncbi:hypothetical protein [Actinoplanes sp. RD1]|uniref:hypothetical protein n=1 Tax=Actinoplanes sp. RD1 TaxID=3064538 RepID=UPI00274203CE|nr:hypothetical protein [Actinoplanes sp. RD1]
MPASLPGVRAVPVLLPGVRAVPVLLPGVRAGPAASADWAEHRVAAHVTGRREA